MPSMKPARLRSSIRILELALLWAALALPGLARSADPEAGMKLFWNKGCVRCHPVLGEGGKVGPDLSRSDATANGLELAAAMWSHAPQMWQRMQQERVVLPTFSQEEVEDLFAFLALVRSFDEPGNAAAGHELFQSKHCVECHSIRGEGGRRGPDLATVASNRNPVAWVAAMWNHVPGMFRALGERGVQFPKFQGTEMVDLQAYIRLKAGAEIRNRTYLHPPSVENGARLFQSKQCIRCHSIGAQGAKVGPDLTRVQLPRRYGEIAVVMWNHAPQMNRLSEAQAVPYPTFQTQELADVLAFLNSLSMRWSGNAASGAATFAAKGCSSCHSVKTGERVGIGPNLTHLQNALTPESIARIMWNHGPTMLKRMESASIAWPVFNSRELADTLAYLESIQKPAGPASLSASGGGKP
jgi:cytochrome c2